ncbi:MAG: hypothetical protein BroJett025_11160 [Patescibacteria group bacterium]|nr:MAG: hypothetical protein BroJett025_11160 [Patescibacteria group bacterium]
MRYQIYTDGGSRGNPGDAAIGGVVYGLKKEIVFEFSKYIGVATNNEAEYTAVLTALEWALQHTTGVEAIDFNLDSKLVVEQMNKKWKIKEPRMLVLAQKCWDLIKELGIEVTFSHVMREKNKEADLLVNQALDAHQQ